MNNEWCARFIGGGPAKPPAIGILDWAGGLQRQANAASQPIRADLLLDGAPCLCVAVLPAATAESYRVATVEQIERLQLDAIEEGKYDGSFGCPEYLAEARQREGL